MRLASARARSFRIEQHQQILQIPRRAKTLPASSQLCTLRIWLQMPKWMRSYLKMSRLGRRCILVDGCWTDAPKYLIVVLDGPARQTDAVLRDM